MKRRKPSKLPGEESPESAVSGCRMPPAYLMGPPNENISYPSSPPPIQSNTFTSNNNNNNNICFSLGTTNSEPAASGFTSHQQQQQPQQQQPQPQPNPAPGFGVPGFGAAPAASSHQQQQQQQQPTAVPRFGAAPSLAGGTAISAPVPSFGGNAICAPAPSFGGKISAPAPAPAPSLSGGNAICAPAPSFGGKISAPAPAPSLSGGTAISAPVPSFGGNAISAPAPSFGGNAIPAQGQPQRNGFSLNLTGASSLLSHQHAKPFPPDAASLKSPPPPPPQQQQQQHQNGFVHPQQPNFFSPAASSSTAATAAATAATPGVDNGVVSPESQQLFSNQGTASAASPVKASRHVWGLLSCMIKSNKHKSVRDLSPELVGREVGPFPNGHFPPATFGNLEKFRFALRGAPSFDNVGVRTDHYPILPTAQFGMVYYASNMDIFPGNELGFGAVAHESALVLVKTAWMAPTNTKPITNKSFLTAVVIQAGFHISASQVVKCPVFLQLVDKFFRQCFGERVAEEMVADLLQGTISELNVSAFIERHFGAHWTDYIRDAKDEELYKYVRDQVKLGLVEGLVNTLYLEKILARGKIGERLKAFVDLKPNRKSAFTTVFGRNYQSEVIRTVETALKNRMGKRVAWESIVSVSAVPPEDCLVHLLGWKASTIKGIVKDDDFMGPFSEQREKLGCAGGHGHALFLISQDKAGLQHKQADNQQLSTVDDPSGMDQLTDQMAVTGFVDQHCRLREYDLKMDEQHAEERKRLATVHQKDQKELFDKLEKYKRDELDRVLAEKAAEKKEHEERLLAQKKEHEERLVQQKKENQQAQERDDKRSALFIQHLQQQQQQLLFQQQYLAAFGVQQQQASASGATANFAPALAPVPGGQQPTTGNGNALASAPVFGASSSNNNNNTVPSNIGNGSAPSFGTGPSGAASTSNTPVFGAANTSLGGVNSSTAFVLGPTTSSSSPFFGFGTASSAQPASVGLGTTGFQFPVNQQAAAATATNAPSTASSAPPQAPFVFHGNQMDTS